MLFRLPTAVLRTRQVPAVRVPARRTLSTTPRMFLKEDADRSPEQIEKKKQEQLEKQKRGEGHWHEELASQGESNVAADREHVKDHQDHMSRLQQETKKKGESGQL